MKARKENKVYKITTDIEKERYLKEGFDIYSDDGKLLEHSPMKKIAYGKYAKLQEENAELLAENTELKERLKELEVGLSADAKAFADNVTSKKGSAKKAGV